MSLKTIKNIKSLTGKVVFLRADFNVPVKNGKILDDFKIQKSLATINFLLRKGAKIILASHLGRPKGIDKKLSLKPIGGHLQKISNKKIKFLDWVAPEEKYLLKVFSQIKKMKNGEIFLLENVRFFEWETDNCPDLAENFSKLADIFVLDGFGVAHRAGSSITGIAKFLPSYAGLLLEEEIAGLSKVLNKPKKPLVVVLGGAKLETKLPLLKKFLSIADKILVGGGLANTFIWATGSVVGGSLVDKKLKKESLKYLKNKKVIMPVDVVIGRKNGKSAKAKKVEKVLKVKTDMGIYDIGPKTIKLFAEHIKKAKTLVWNGAMGMFEAHPYEYGTRSIARLFAARSKGKSFGVCGGGETVEVLKDLNLLEDVDLVSTGGGAMLEFLSGEKLPGLKSFEKK